MSDLGDEIRRHIEKTFSKGVSVPTDCGEDDAIRSVQEQFGKAGYECPKQTAREIVQEAWRRAG